METLFHLPASLREDLEKFQAETERFKSGAISPAEFRSFRVPQGVYEQREAGEFMLRVRLPAGAVFPHQMRTFASVARKYGNPVLHVTSRQDIQIHNVGLDGLHPALVQLYGAGLSTKGGGGNTVRNITACCHAGVCPPEAFDVTAYSAALTEFLLPDPLSYQLPRKYKIAFSGCPKDCAGATVNDLGFIAKLREGQRGFTVCVAGGMGARSRVADLLADFVPAPECHLVAEAIKRVFDKHGNRRNRSRARLRFLVERLGFEAFRELYEGELAQLRKADVPPLQVREVPRRERPVTEAQAPLHEGFGVWRARNVVPQKQDGYHLVHVPLVLGDIAADMLEGLGDIAGQHGEGMVRTTQWQNLLVRWVHQQDLAALHGKLTELDLARGPAPILRNTVACAGASTCKPGICLSRGLARAVTERLVQDGLDLDGLGELDVHISGCPNACGRHPIGDIGFFGAARRVGGRLVPHYVVQLGGRTADGGARLAQGRDAIPARHVPAFMVEFLRAFQRSAWYPDYDAFLEAQGRQIAERVAAEHKHVPSFEEDKNHYYDWGAETPFSLAGRGPGECGAGVFELIEVDLASARDALRKGEPFAAVVLASRALLVTQGQEAKDDAGALDLFTRHFLDARLVDDSLRVVIESARCAAGAADAQSAFDASSGQVSALIEAVRHLYDNMDPSLRFRPADQPQEPAAGAAAAGGVDIDQEGDLRGIACPLNYVKTKMTLDQMSGGQVLSVLVGSEGARNVPDSVRNDGHQVLSVTQEGDHWRVVIRKS